ncbi:hypothetical protein P7C73_g883, partial [Tremellales sp. Uapishka_1]
MFFTDELLTKKNGSLGIIWLAATLGPRNRRLTKKNLIQVDLPGTCDLIIHPPEPMALRLQSSLLVGVARVYGQNYEMFYTDVNTFHHTLRRSIVTDLAPANGGGSNSTREVDLAGGGKSKNDQITFGVADAAWDTGLDFGFENIDWNNPIDTRKRRASSRLSSLGTEDDAKSDDEHEDDDEDESETGAGRAEKRRRLSSSPGRPPNTASARKINLPRKTIHTNNPGILDPFGEEFEFEQHDLGLDMEGDDSNHPANTSGATVDGIGFQLPDEGDNLMLDESGLILQSTPYKIRSYRGSEDPETGPGGFEQDGEHLPNFGEIPAIGPLSSDRSIIPGGVQPKKTAGRTDSEESSIVGDDEVAVVALKKKSKKQRKKVAFDDVGSRTLEMLRNRPALNDPQQDLELSDEQQNANRRDYVDNMDLAREEIEAKEREKQVLARATAMVDSGGGWLQFLDPEMDLFFSTITHAPKFKWEQDVSAHRAGKKLAETTEVGEAENRQTGLAEDVFGPQMEITTFDEGDLQHTYEENYIDYSEPVRDRELQAENAEMEIGRRDTQSSLKLSQALPWEETSFGQSEGNDPGVFDMANSTFTPGSLKLSIMTPREARLRRNTRAGSLTTSGPRSMKRIGRRARSNSLLGSDIDENLMLIGGDDLELPEDDYDLGSFRDSEGEPNEVPHAFRPEMLATLENQCRDFFVFIEKTLVVNKQNEIDFDDLVPVTSKKRVAATAFYNCLTLATKRIINVAQPDPWQAISIDINADVDYTAAAE